MRYDLDFWRPSWPFGREYAALQRNINRLFGDMVPAEREFEGMEFYPAADMEETEHELKLMIDLPGVKKDDVKVEATEDSLTVSGDRIEEHEEKKKNRQMFERRYGHFERSFALPSSVDTSKVNAEFENGVLRVTVPKTAATKKQQIPIKEGKAAGKKIEAGREKTFQS